MKEKDIKSVDVSNIDTTDSIKMLNHMSGFYNANKDTVGWLFLNGTKINYPVVQTIDNDKYLHTDFFGNESQPGTLFMDYRCNIDDIEDMQSDNIIIYGHKQADGEMFGTLNKYQDDVDFYNKYPTIIFQNLYKTYLYKIMGVFVIEATSVEGITDKTFDYQNYINFENEGKYTFKNFIDNVKSRSDYDTLVDIQEGDKFITLSTCSYDFSKARFVVVGRRLRENENLN